MRSRLTLPFAMLVLLAPAGCSMQKKEALRAESPDHAVVATLMEEVGGGATVSTVYDLNLSSRHGGDRKLPRKTRWELAPSGLDNKLQFFRSDRSVEDYGA